MTRTEQKKIEPPTEKDYELARQTYAWMESLVDSEKAEKNDYLWNLSVYGKAGVVNMKGLGIVASAVSSFQREMNDKAQRAELAGSQHVGTIGDRLTVFVTVIALNPTQYGMCQKLLTAEGNVLTAFGTFLEHAEGEKKGERVKQGDQLWVKGTVKRHSEFKGVNETLMNRPTGCADPVNAKAAKAAAAKVKREQKKVRDAARKAFGAEQVIAEYGWVINNEGSSEHGKRCLSTRIVQLSTNEFIIDRMLYGEWSERDALDTIYNDFDAAERYALRYSNVERLSYREETICSA